MIQGAVNAGRESILQVTVRDANGQEHPYDAVLDTGYTGWLTLPPSVVASLGLAWRDRGGGILADGSRAIFDVYTATVLWDRSPRDIPVDAIDADPLVGMSLMYGYELNLRVLDGAVFTLRSLVNP